MITALLAAGAGIVVGFLVGGCTNGGDELSQQLLYRNAALESQLSAGQNTLTGMAVTCVLLACGLAVSMFIKGRKRAGK